jgi:hypothetical protein
MTKVISFSLWGNDPKYVQGAIRNAEIALDLFPDWECWFYLPSLPIHPIVGLMPKLGNVKFILEPDSAPDWRAMFLRFQPASDTNVEAMISRDCDSRLSQREKVAVDAWMESDKGFHIMRDHPWHGSHVLGGMWGVKNSVLPDMDTLMEDWNQEDRWQTDQDFLTTIVYPRIVNDSMIHASFFKMETHARDFPLPRIGTEFIGKVFDENEKTVAEHVQALVQAL